MPYFATSTSDWQMIHGWSWLDTTNGWLINVILAVDHSWSKLATMNRIIKLMDSQVMGRVHGYICSKQLGISAGYSHKLSIFWEGNQELVRCLLTNKYWLKRDRLLQVRIAGESCPPEHYQLDWKLGMQEWICLKRGTGNPWIGEIGTQSWEIQTLW